MKIRITAMTIIILVLSAVTGLAANIDSVDIRFKKSGGGQFIYCNNPEFLSAMDMSTDENPEPVYMMKNEGLKPGKYSVFFCFYNWTDFDVEPDIEFFSKDAKITIDAVGYYIPKGWDYWDCLGAWSDYMGMNIRTIDGLSQYVPCAEIDMPQTFSLKNSSEWINKYIYNYESVSPNVTFNMLVDFTIEEGTADVNLTALKSYDILGDRTHHSYTALQSPYKNDTSIKGIEKETLPMVEAQLNVEITSKIHDGNNIPARIYNQYFSLGNTYDYWMTNINPNRDDYAYSKECSACTDMLEFEFKDNSKFKYYGSSVQESAKDNIWHFDIYHYNTTAYEEGCPTTDPKRHIPNAEHSSRLDISNPPDVKYEFNLGNFGVTNRYHLNVKNSDSVPRSINYFIDASKSSCIVAVRDKNGTLLNPYTLSEEDAYALSKGINWEKKKDYMFSLMLNPGEEKEVILDVILPTNCYGGIVNGLTVDSKLLCEPEDIVGFARKDEEYEYYERIWFDGSNTRKWVDGELYTYVNNQWKKEKLPQSAKEIFQSKTKDMQIIKTPTGYIARFAGYDQYGRSITDQDIENKLYIFDDKFEYVKAIDMPQYISAAVYADGVTYIKSDKIYQTENGITFTPSSLTEMPLSNGKSVVEKRNDGWYIRFNGEKEYTKLNFEYNDAGDIQAGDGIYYRVISLKNYDTDHQTPNIIAVSTDGINFRNMNLPNSQFRFMKLDCIDNIITAVGRNETFSNNKADYTGGIKIKTENGWMSPDYVYNTLDSSVFYSLDYLAEVFGFEMDKEEKNGKLIITAYKDDRHITAAENLFVMYNGEMSRFVAQAPYRSGNTLYVPFKDFMEIMGYEITVENETTISVNS